MTDGTDDKRLAAVRRQISDWLLAESWQLSDATQAASGSAWAIKATDGTGRTVVFAQGAAKPDALVMQAAISVDKTSLAKLGELGAKQQDELAWKIRFQLVNMGVKFAGLDTPLERFTLVMRVYADDLGRNDFFDRLDRLLDAINASIWLIRQTLAQPAPQDAGSETLEIN